MNSKKEVQHVYLVGAKSLGAYGGYETFVYKLTEYHQNKENIKYHVACKANGDGCMDESKFDGVTKINEHEFELHNAHCFKIDVPQIGPAQAIYYDVAALKACCEHIKENHIPHPIVYIMACRIGPFAGYFYREIHKLGGTVYLNPDGHEWMRAKWSAPIRKYWKISEQMMVKYCDLAICDSVNIEKYIHECYDGKGIKGRNPKTTFIAYGADLTLSKLADDDEKLVNWYKEKGLTKKDYYLVVGRFVPENSFEVMIREFMKSKSKKNFAIITNVNEKFLNELEENLHFKSDKRIKFVGTVYDQELLKKIRENAYAYFHGHTVGGTNPSLIEALGSTDWQLIERKFRDSDMSFLDALAGLFSGCYNNLDFNIHLWFLPCFFVTVALFNILVNLGGRKISYIASALMSLIYILLPMPEFPWGFNRVFKYIGFYAVGTVLARRKAKIIDKKLEAGITAIVLFGLNFFLSFRNLTSRIMWFVTAFIGVTAIILVSQFINKNGILQYFGRISLIVLCIHGPVYRIVVKIISIPLHMSTEAVRESFLLAMIVVTVTMFICSVTYEIVIRTAPWMVGKKRIKR